MSQFFSNRYASLIPYVPGEQPRDMQYIKLNTNESPFPPSPGVEKAVQQAGNMLQLYSDPESTRLRKKIAQLYGLDLDQVMVTNGSDEGLNFAFMAFADEKSPLAFPDLTYGFYKVFADLNHIPYTTIPLTEDFCVNTEDYIGIGKTIVLANPNAPSGRSLPLSQIARILESNPRNVVIVDEAYVDFGGESALPLLQRYPNLLITQTFSKSRSMAGARLGLVLGSEELIADLNTLRYSTNPYNVNRMTEAAGIAALEENQYYMDNCRTIQQTREWTARQLESIGFTVVPSCTNFLLASDPRLEGQTLYKALKSKGILVRHFQIPRIQNYIRITIGTQAQMEQFIQTVKQIQKEALL